MSATVKKTVDVFDPRYHYSIGQDLEASGKWGRALIHYQKAITCMPHILGVPQWFQQYLMDGRQPISLSRAQVAGVYTAMGRCYASCGLSQNALLALRAAAVWNPTTSSVGRLKNAVDDVTQRPAPVPPCTTCRENTADGHVADIGDRVTIIIITNFTSKLIKYKALSPPTSKLVSTTYRSLLQSFGPTLTLCPKILCYDLPSEHDGQSRSYQNALEIFSRRHGFDLYMYSHIGLHAIFRHIMPMVKTPYIALVEHDWLFQGPSSIPIIDLLDLFSRHPDIHLVRFNKRKNYILNWDFIMEHEDCTKAVPLLRTSAYSNNPCIIRTAKLVNDWLPICASDPFFSSKDQSGSAMGIEESLLKRFMQEIRQSGFTNAHRRWGTYIFGLLGEPARILHLGE